MSNRPRINAAQLLINQPWALKKDVLEHGLKMLGASVRDFQAAAGGYDGAADGGLYVRDGVAVIDIVGPITRYETCLSAMYGYATVESALIALELAASDQSVRAILLNLNSPGGSVDGISELGDMVKRSGKPVVAYVGGMAASAAYWIASQAGMIVVNQTGMLGSIGVYAAYMDDRRAMKEAGYDEYVIVSSQSPNKVPDPATESGRSQIQREVDALADIFIQTVASGRGVRVQTVMERFGQGDVFLGAEAVSRKMADTVGNFEDAFKLAATEGGLLSRTFAEASDKRFESNTAGVAQADKSTNEEVDHMDIDKLKAEHPDLFKAAMAEGAAQERARIAAIDALEAEGFEDIIKGAKADPNATAGDTALKILKAQAERRAKIKANREEDAKEVPGVIDQQGSDETKDDEAVGLLKGAFKSKKANREVK